MYKKINNVAAVRWMELIQVNLTEILLLIVADYRLYSDYITAIFPRETGMGI